MNNIFLTSNTLTISFIIIIFIQLTSIIFMLLSNPLFTSIFIPKSFITVIICFFLNNKIFISHTTTQLNTKLIQYQPYLYTLYYYYTNYSTNHSNIIIHINTLNNINFITFIFELYYILIIISFSKIYIFLIIYFLKFKLKIIRIKIINIYTFLFHL